MEQDIFRRSRCAQTATDTHSIRPSQQSGKLFRIISSVTRYNCLREKLLDNHPVLLRCINLHQAGSHSIGRPCRQITGSCHSPASRDHKDSAVTAFMRIRFSRREQRRNIRSVIRKTHFGITAKEIGTDPDGNSNSLPCALFPRKQFASRFHTCH